MLCRRFADLPPPARPPAVPNASSIPTPIDLARRPSLALGAARIEPSVLALEGPQARVTVEPRVMQVLLALADAGGAVVARDTLMDLCWGSQVVGEDALNRAVAGVRRVVRQAGLEAAITVETIPRVGYRLQVVGGVPAVATVPLSLAANRLAPAHESEPEPKPEPAAAPAAPSAGHGRRRLLGAAAFTAAAGGLALWLRTRADPASAQALMAQGDQALRLATSDADRRGALLYAQAVQLVPNHASAWGRLALARHQVAEAAPPDQYPSARAAADEAIARALALDPRQPDALAARALLVPAFGAWARAEDALKTVLLIDPEHLPTLDALVLVLSSAGTAAGHLAMRQKTVSADPFNAGYNFRSIYSGWMNGQIGAADRAGERGLELWPRHFATWLARSSLFAFTGRPQRALAMLDDADRLPALPPPLAAAMRSTYAALVSERAADRAAARETVLRTVAAGGPLMAVSASMMLASLGEVSLALDVTEAYLLERGPIVAGTSWQPGQLLHVDLRRRSTNYLFLPVMAQVREDPRFEDIVREVGMTAYWLRDGRKPDYLGARPIPA